MMTARQMLIRKRINNRDTIKATTIDTEKERNVEKPQKLPAIMVAMKKMKKICKLSKFYSQ